MAFMLEGEEEMRFVGAQLNDDCEDFLRMPPRFIASGHPALSSSSEYPQTSEGRHGDTTWKGF